jgi:hypothetical protein
MFQHDTLEDVPDGPALAAREPVTKPSLDITIYS